MANGPELRYSMFQEKPESRDVLLSKAVERLVKLVTKEFKVEGKERVPERGALVIANHSSHFDGFAMAAALAGRDIGIVSNESGDHPLPAPVRKFLDWLAVTPVRITPGHWKEEDYQRLRDAEDGTARVIERWEDPETKGEDARANMKALHEIVDDLVDGKVKILFPEGGFINRDDVRLRNPAGGMEIIAKLYKKRTGNDLKIVPAGIDGAPAVLGADPNMAPELLSAIKKTVSGKNDAKVTVRFGEPFTLAAGDDPKKAFQERVGSLLPPEYQPAK